MDQNLVDYIKQQIQSGANKEDIKGILRTQGWHEKDIKEGFGAVDSSHITKPISSRKKFKTVIFVVSLITLLIMVGGGFVYFYIWKIGQPMISKSGVDLDGMEKEEITQIEYISPYGFRFKYPSSFRFAEDYADFEVFLGSPTIGDSKEVVIALTTASEEEEHRYIKDAQAFIEQSGLNPFDFIFFGDISGVPIFAPNQSIIITLDDYIPSIEDLIKLMSEETQKKLQQLDIPTPRIEDPKEIVAADGTKGTSYIQQHSHELSYIYVSFPLKKPVPVVLNESDIFNAGDQDYPYDSLTLRVSANAPEELKAVFDQIISSLHFFEL